MILKKKILFLLLNFLLTNIFLSAEEGMVIIDNFNQNDLKKNSLNKNVSIFLSNKQVILNLDKNNAGIEDKCLKIEYNISPTKTNFSGTVVQQINDGKQKVEFSETPTFAGYFTEIKDIDFTKYDYLVLYIKGDKEKGFSRNLKLELKDKRNVSSYVLEGITDEWQKFVVPVTVFSGINLKKANVLGIVFSSDVVTKKEGVIYVDKIFVAKKFFVKQQKIKINKNGSLLKIDGDLSDWKNSKWYNLDIKDNLEIGKIASKQDLDAKFSLQYDDNYLYIAAKISDNEILCREVEKDLWRDDCVEIYIDPNNDGLIWGNEKDFQIGISPLGPENKPQIYAWFQEKIPTKDEVYYEVTNYKSGYDIEMKIDWKFLNFVPKEKDSFGFSISVQDVDTIDESSGKLSYCFIKDVEKILLAEVKLK